MLVKRSRVVAVAVQEAKACLPVWKRMDINYGWPEQDNARLAYYYHYSQLRKALRGDNFATLIYARQLTRVND